LLQQDDLYYFFYSQKGFAVLNDLHGSYPFLVDLFPASCVLHEQR
jgi:hypothetical protein